MKTIGLTLKEAIESGRGFRRPGDKFFYRKENLLLTWNNVLATDYELKPVEEQKIELTAKLIEQAHDTVMKKYAGLPIATLKDILKELGFDVDEIHQATMSDK